MSLSKTAKCLSGLKSNLCIIVGSQWGDEGKGKLVDILAPNYDYCARFNGGANAGHTIVANGIKYPFHLLPCGILYDHTINVLGNGTVVKVQGLFEELVQLDRDKIDYRNRLFVSDRAHLVTRYTIAADVKHESDITKKQIGSTKQGIGPTYAAKANRVGLRIGDLKDWDLFVQKYNYGADWFEENGNVKVDRALDLKELKEIRGEMLQRGMITDTVAMMHNAIKSGKRVLAEGANACMLDIDFGTYPYVTSSPTNAGGVQTGLGIPASRIETTIGIVKAYCTRVGEGPFPTEQLNEKGDYLQKTGFEFGVTTGRVRRCGWIDIPQLRYANMINDYTSINITKLDVLDDLDEIEIGVSYKLDGKIIDYMPSVIEEYARVEVVYETVPGWKQSIFGVTDYNKLPENAKRYLARLEQLLEVPVSWIGTGPERESMALKE